MTLVFDRGPLPDHPVTHALVIGCGRFPHKAGLDREATTAGARRVMEFLSARADQFVAPIWTIRCLLSETKVAPGQDTLKATLPDPGSGAFVAPPATHVDSVLLGDAVREGYEWLKTLDDDQREGDSPFFYMSSHGLADPANAIGLCEDVLSNKYKKWTQSLNVTALANGLGTLKLGRAWVFLDACQEIVPSLLGAPTGMPGHRLIEYSVQDLVGARRAVALAGSSFGKKAWAPRTADPPYFTQALLEGLSNACVERVENHGWAITATLILSGLPQVGRAIGLKVEVDCEPLTIFNGFKVPLLKVPDPDVPVALSTEVAAHLQQAQINLVCSDPAVQPPQPPAALGPVWLFRVGAHNRPTYKATATLAGGVAYHPGEFEAEPPGQVVMLRRV